MSALDIDALSRVIKDALCAGSLPMERSDARDALHDIVTEIRRLRTALAEHDALAARVVELESALRRETAPAEWQRPPHCSCTPDQGPGYRCEDGWIRCNSRLAFVRATTSGGPRD